MLLSIEVEQTVIHILWWKKPDLKDCNQYNSLLYDIPVKEEVWGQKSEVFARAWDWGI